MPGILLSGPAGGNKSDAARRRIAGASEPTVAADFQAIFVALTLQRRDPATGLYPTRTAADAALFPLVEYVRTTITRQAQAQGMDVVHTNSDGSPARRAALLERLGPDATEEVIDPGRPTVVARLSDAAGNLSGPCGQALDRWYGRLARS